MLSIVISVVDYNRPEKQSKPIGNIFDVDVIIICKGL